MKAVTEENFQLSIRQRNPQTFVSGHVDFVTTHESPSAVDSPWVGVLSPLPPLERRPPFPPPTLCCFSLPRRNTGDSDWENKHLYKALCVFPAVSRVSCTPHPSEACCDVALLLSQLTGEEAQ